MGSAHEGGRYLGLPGAVGHLSESTVLNSCTVALM